MYFGDKAERDFKEAFAQAGKELSPTGYIEDNFDPMDHVRDLNNYLISRRAKKGADRSADQIKDRVYDEAEEETYDDYDVQDVEEDHQAYDED